MKDAFTIMELIVAIVIISILAGLGIASYSSAKEKVLDKEAISNLKLLRVAESSYATDMGTYYPPPTGSVSTIASINTYMKTSLTTKSWNYTVYSTGCSKATRIASDLRSWYLTIDDADGEPNSGVGCP